MFKVSSKSKLWKDIINMASALVEEIKVDVTSEGMSIRAVDASHIAMLSLEIPKSAFTVYEADETEIGIPLDKMRDAFKTVGSEVSVEYDVDKGRLVIKSDNLTRRMNVLDTSSMSPLKIPAIDVSTSVTVPTSEIQKSIVASTGVADAVGFTFENNGLIISSGKDAEDSVEMVLMAPALTDIKITSRVYTMIPLDYFTKTVKVIPAEQVTLSTDNDYPMKVSFNDNGLSGMYLIAPRIESE